LEFAKNLQRKMLALEKKETQVRRCLVIDPRGEAKNQRKLALCERAKLSILVKNSSIISTSTSISIGRLALFTILTMTDTTNNIVSGTVARYVHRDREVQWASRDFKALRGLQVVRRDSRVLVVIRALKVIWVSKVSKDCRA
jgi:hypothetical protein